ncbi:hypothetical protein Dda_8645 [Drechslerella dactyloides]|uniref:Uncharacterized protein n=1 Tax=Drechslerella dactyloides TaxID=74499 RepID=A0AAD6NHH7_DREDA|nr:hypothetical protein Dda_8645 [Drechslerella dactyloides]
MVSGVADVYSNAWISRIADDSEGTNTKTTLGFYACQLARGKYFPMLSSYTLTVIESEECGASIEDNSKPTTSSQHHGFGSHIDPKAKVGCYSIDTHTHFTPTDRLILGLATFTAGGAEMPVPVGIVRTGFIGDAEAGDVIEFNFISTISGCYGFYAPGAGFGHIKFATTIYQANKPVNILHKPLTVSTCDKQQNQSLQGPDAEEDGAVAAPKRSEEKAPREEVSQEVANVISTVIRNMAGLPAGESWEVA